MTDRRLSRRAAHGARVIEMTVPPPRLFRSRGDYDVHEDRT